MLPVTTDGGSQAKEVKVQLGSLIATRRQKLPGEVSPLLCTTCPSPLQLPQQPEGKVAAFEMYWCHFPGLLSKSFFPEYVDCESRIRILFSSLFQTFILYLYEHLFKKVPIYYSGQTKKTAQIKAVTSIQIHFKNSQKKGKKNLIIFTNPSQNDKFYNRL